MKNNQYNILGHSVFLIDKIKLVPVNYSHILKIKEWRNEQIKFLRQKTPITDKDQIEYYNQVIKPSFIDTKPKQILFSIIEDNNLIGYCGLVHIDWFSRNAELSFLLETKLYNDQDQYFEKFSSFLKMIQQIAKKIGLHKIYTFGYDVLCYRFKPLISQKFTKEANLVDHVLVENKLTNVLIYSKII